MSRSDERRQEEPIEAVVLCEQHANTYDPLEMCHKWFVWNRVTNLSWSILVLDERGSFGLQDSRTPPPSPQPSTTPQVEPSTVRASALDIFFS